MSVLTAEALLAGADLSHTITLPDHLVGSGADPGAATDPADVGDAAEVVLRPLLLADVIRLQKATGSDQHLATVMMVHQSLVEPELSIEQVHRLPAGVVEFLLGEVNRVSGLSLTADDLRSLVHEPLARACLVLAREFGWTPDQCAELTVGQLLLYLEMVERGEQP